MAKRSGGDQSNDDRKNDKQFRRDLQRIQQQARAAQEAGDYRIARQLYEELGAAEGAGSAATAARAELQNFKLDAWTLRIGVGAVVLYGLTWAVALS